MRRGCETKGEKKWIFAWKMAQGGRQKVWVLLTMFFVKHTNQGEFLKLYLMLKSEER